jgi:hypothetical protein
MPELKTFNKLNLNALNAYKISKNKAYFDLRLKRELKQNFMNLKLVKKHQN